MYIPVGVSSLDGDAPGHGTVIGHEQVMHNSNVLSDWIVGDIFSGVWGEGPTYVADTWDITLFY